LAAALLAAAALLRARLSFAVIVLRMLLATFLITLLAARVLTTLLATLILTTLVLVRHNTLANNFDGLTIGPVARAECRTKRSIRVSVGLRPAIAFSRVVTVRNRVADCNGLAGEWTRAATDPSHPIALL
jgi:hypothetical protein